MISALDDSVGELFSALRETGMLGHSVVLFTTDNGAQSQGFCAAGGCSPDLEGASSNFPLRGAKFDLWEGGIRGVGVLWSPLLKPTSHHPREGTATGSNGTNSTTGLRSHSRRQQLMHITDWLPTLYHAAGGDVKSLGQLDGFDQWSALLRNDPSPRAEILLNIDPVFDMMAIKSGSIKLIAGDLDSDLPYFNNRWLGVSGRDESSGAIWSRLPSMADSSLVAKSIRGIGRRFHRPTTQFYRDFNVSCGPVPLSKKLEVGLFDLEKDPCEYTNLAKERPEVVRALLKKLEVYNATVYPVHSFEADEKCNPDKYGFIWTNWGDEHPITISLS